MIEIWKPVLGYEDYYEISNCGRIKRLNREVKPKGRKSYFVKEKILSPANNGNGYFHIVLSKDNVKTDKLIHKLVAESFIPNPENKPEVGHKDESRNNNYAENLEWVTSKENSNMPLHRQRLSDSNMGKNKGSKHSEESILKMKANSYWKGKEIPKEIKDKMKENRVYKTGGEHAMAIKVECEGIIYNCIKECADFYKVSNSNLTSFLNGKKIMPKKWIKRGLKYYKN